MNPTQKVGKMDQEIGTFQPSTNKYNLPQTRKYLSKAELAIENLYYALDKDIKYLNRNI